MPTFSSFGEFGAALDKMEADLKSERTKIALAMGERAQSIARSEASADLGGDLKFTHWAPTWDTHLKKIEDGVVLLPTRSGAGVITVANQGRHNGNANGFSGPGINHKSGVTARTKSGGLRKVRSSRGKHWNGSTVGMHTADRAVSRIEVELPAMADLGIRAVIARHFDVS